MGLAAVLWSCQHHECQPLARLRGQDAGKSSCAGVHTCSQDPPPLPEEDPYLWSPASSPRKYLRGCLQSSRLR